MEHSKEINVLLAAIESQACYPVRYHRLVGSDFQAARCRSTGA